MNSDYDKILTFADEFTATHELHPVSGELYGLADTPVYHSAKHVLPEKGRVEVNRTVENAPPSFEWIAELTIDNRAGGQFIHLIARRDGTIAETYGKNVIPIDAKRAKVILDLLNKLTA